MKKWIPAVLALALCMGVSPDEAAAQGDAMLDMATFPRPIDAVDNIWIEELTMLEVRDLLREVLEVSFLACIITTNIVI